MTKSQPIPIDLLALENTPNTPKLSPGLINDEFTDLRSFTVVHLGKETYTLSAKTQESRQEWWDSITTLKFNRAESLRTQNAEPFGLRVLANAAFGSNKEAKGVGSIPMSPLFGPLNHAIQNFESRYGNLHSAPINKVKVNCASSYTSRSESMLAVGTDSGVYITKLGSTEIWLKVVYPLILDEC